MNAVVQQLEPAGKPPSVRNSVNRMLRELRADVNKTEVEMGVAVEMLLEHAHHVHNCIQASAGKGRLDVSSKTDQVKRLSERLVGLTAKLEQQKNQVTVMEDFKQEVKSA